MNVDNQAIRIRALFKTFRTGLRRKKTRALKGLDLDVARGEIFGFLGPNGAGKTTAIKILVGLLKADSGEASLLGRPVADVSCRRRMAYLPELPDFYDYLTPVELLFHCGLLSGLDRHHIKRRVPELLERVGLDPEEKRSLRKFSKGMLQRVGIAQTMLADPDVYILDEPMGGLDPLGRRWVKDLILELGKSGKTVFFSSHVLSEAEAVCDRVAFLHRGRLMAQGSLREVLEAHTDCWEIQVEGHAVRTDENIQPKAARIEPAGPDTLLVPAVDRPDALLGALLAGGHRIRSVNQRHASLEEVFVRTLSGSGEQREGEG
jgi:ABC-2 type transport system ATP-binding protein